MRNIIQMTLRVSERSLPRESKRLVVLSDEISHILRNEVSSNEQSDIRELLKKKGTSSDNQIRGRKMQVLSVIGRKSGVTEAVLFRWPRCEEVPRLFP